MVKKEDVKQIVATIESIASGLMWSKGMANWKGIDHAINSLDNLADRVNKMTIKTPRQALNLNLTR